MGEPAHRPKHVNHELIEHLTPLPRPPRRRPAESPAQLARTAAAHRRNRPIRQLARKQINDAVAQPALTVRGRAALGGIEVADSVTLDPHKWLYQPIECGCLLVREGDLLPQAFTINPDYLADYKSK